MSSSDEYSDRNNAKKQCTQVATRSDEKQFLLGLNFAMLGLTREEEARVIEIVNLHGGQMENSDASKTQPCSHVVVGYWFQCTYRQTIPSKVYVSLYWLEHIHAKKRLIPYDASMVYQPPNFHASHVHSTITFPIDFSIPNLCEMKSFVELPCYPNSMLIHDVPRWPYIVALLSHPIRSAEDLEITIQEITGQYRRLKCLRKALEIVPDFISSVLPALIQIALDLPQLFPSPLPRLTQQTNNFIELTKRQIAALLVHGFLCTFPHAEESYNHFNFGGIHLEDDVGPSWGGSSFDTNVQKLLTLFHYFRRIVHTNAHDLDNQRVRYSRRFSSPEESTPHAYLQVAKNQVKWSDIQIHEDGAIESHHGALQVDFANKFPGGGVLGHGCVQEEIRFLINPECIVSCLLIQVLEPNECFLIHGAEQYASYSGYGQTYAFHDNFIDETPVLDGIRDTVIVGIDAAKYYRNTTWHQYRLRELVRELTKACIGFKALSNERNLRPIATGNWGCGVFGGDVELKFLIQWIAASLSHRQLVYYTFGNSNLAIRFHSFVNWFHETTLTIHDILSILFDIDQHGISLQNYMRKSKSVFEWVNHCCTNRTNN